MSMKFNVEVDCANCANKLEDAIKNIGAVENCTVNFMAQKMFVEFVDGVDKETALAEIIKIAKKVDPDIVIYN